MIFLQNRPIYFYFKATVLLEQSNETSFSSIEINKANFALVHSVL